MVVKLKLMADPCDHVTPVANAMIQRPMTKVTHVITTIPAIAVL